MKKYLFIFVCMTICMTIMSGCNSNHSSSSIPGIENSLTENGSSSPIDITNWEPTAYEIVNNLKGVVMTVKESTVSPAGLTVVFENNSDSQCLYGAYFALEKKINENWYQVPVTIEGNYAFDAIGYDLASGGDSELTIDWEWLYGNLETGEYRILKDILDFRGTGDFDTYYFTAEFIVSEIAACTDNRGTTETTGIISELETYVSDAIISHNDKGRLMGEFRTESHVTLKTLEDKNTVVVYLMAYYAAYDFPDESPKQVSGSHIPVALTFLKDENGGYVLTEYWEASDGSHYWPSIRNKFPSDISEQAINTQLYVKQQQAACDEKVKKYLRSRSSEEELLLMIMSSPKEASNPNAYIVEHREEYNILVSRGDTALRYIYARFLEGGQTGLEGWIMLSVCREILGSEYIQFETNTPQEWFDAFTELAIRTRNANSNEYMEKHKPRVYLLLQMIDKTKE